MKNAIAIEHGENTCAVRRGEFCLFFGTKKFGSVPVCLLFDQELYANANGWTMRCFQCKDLFTGDRIVTKEDLK